MSRKYTKQIIEMKAWGKASEEIAAALGIKEKAAYSRALRFNRQQGKQAVSHRQNPTRILRPKI